MTTPLNRRILNNWQLYLFLLLPVAFIIIFHYVPMVGAQIAFRRYSARLGIWGSPWIGMDNFVRFFNSHMFSRVVVNTIVLSVLGIVFSFPVPIIFALMMNSFEFPWYKKVGQTIVNLPHFISTVVLVGMLFQIFNSNTGLYGNLMFALNDRYPPDLFARPQNFRIMFIGTNIWSGFGWGSIIYLAALAGVSPELHEAAIIDGATRVQRIRYVDFPCILPTITILLILRTGGIMSIGFEMVFLMQNGLNLPVSEVISTYVYKVGLTGTSDFSFSTAIGLFNSIINMFILAGVNLFARKVGETSLW